MTGSVSRNCFSGCLLDGFGWHFSARHSRFSLLCVSPANKTTTRWHYPNWCPSELSLQLFRGFACPNVSLFSFPSPPLFSLLLLPPTTEKCEGGDPAEADKFLPAMEEEVLQTQRKDSLLCQRLQGTRMRKAAQSCLNESTSSCFFLNHIYFHTKPHFAYRPTCVVILSTFILRGYVSRWADVFLFFHFISL